MSSHKRKKKSIYWCEPFEFPTLREGQCIETDPFPNVRHRLDTKFKYLKFSKFHTKEKKRKN